MGILLIFGVIILVIGLLTVILVRVQPLRQSDLQLPRILYQRQESTASIDPQAQRLTFATTGFRLAYYVGRLIFTRERPAVVVALLSIVVGLIILAGPSRSQTVTIDKSQQQVELRQPSWFFRSRVERYPLENISEVRIERERANIKSGQNFGVNLIISHSEGTPLSRNYIHYKTVFPLSHAYRYDYDRAKAMVEQIRNFMAKA
jgi:hypothetical protein